MAEFTDNFNRADGAVGSNWTTLTGVNALQVISNQVNAAAVAPNIAGGHVATATATFAADQEAECQISAWNPFDRCGPGVRMSGDNGYIAYAFSTTNLSIQRMDGGALTGLGSAYNWGGTSSLVRLSVEGTTVKLFVDGVERVSVTDSTHATGQPGLYYNRGDSGLTRLDDFYATDLGGEPACPRVVVNATGDIQ